ncbi:hypothetical protein NHP190003_14760 [Helicobacter sp. NHP19-003]|uniref:Outer membrane protein n=1 Tax=Helicobacter gastrocanis TaxID=2849641 RepID=A0ABN6I6D6_9HELI|nr:outer membrane protein [Helicobacter sp. NHP19-003]BCZ18194.1 hypothetical protein NHP190003_14760 [Helicobacter sp. NHP19-003]
MPLATPKTHLQALIDGDGIPKDVVNYKQEERGNIATNTNALLRLVEGNTNSTAQAVGSLVAGTDKFFSQMSKNAQISQNLKDSFAGFYTLAANTSHDLAAMQSSLARLIAQVERLQQDLLNTLLNTSIRVPRQDGLSAAHHGQDLAPKHRQAKGTAIQDLGTLLAYLKATQNKLSAYAKEHPGSLALSASPLAGVQSGSVNGDLYGFNAQLGYKHFFGKKKRFGLRYYGSFSYQYGKIQATALSNLVYGAGADALYNFYESTNGRYTTGLFVGFMLAGSTWLLKDAKGYKSLANSLKAGGWQVRQHTTYFQIPLNVGFRSNVSKHHGFEVGLRIPLALNSYLKAQKNQELLDLSYKRNVSVFVNYVYNF